LRPICDDEKDTLPQITLTAPHPWDPTVLDAKVDDNWYKKTVPPSDYNLKMLFDAVGRLHDHPINDDKILSNQEDRHHQSVDRAGIKALLADLIKDKIQDEFYVATSKDNSMKYGGTNHGETILTTSLCRLSWGDNQTQTQRFLIATLTTMKNHLS
jgi:hypothetical protein